MSYGQVNADVIGTSVAGSNLGAGNASLMKSRIINGAMVIDQRNAGASVTGADANYAVDRYQMYLSNSTGSKGNMQQNQGSVTPPVGFTNYLGFTTTSAYSVGTLDGYALQQRIEGYNMADFGWGTANAKTVTLSFWAYSSLTGTFGGAIANGGANYAYPFSYSIPVANTWTQISVTIAGATSGTWLTTNGIGAFVSFSLGTGTTYSGTAGAWTGSFKISATGATSVVGTNGATFYITGCQLEVGSSATGFEYRQYQQELALCQRYYYKIINGSGNSRVLSGYITTTTQAIHVLNMPVSMRTSPTALETDGTASHYAISNLNTDTTCSAVPSYNDATVNTVSVVGTVTAGLVAGGGCQLRYLNAAGYLAVSAEL